MPPIILGGPGQLSEYNDVFPCGRRVVAKCEAGIRNEGRVVISKETNRIITIEEMNGQGFKPSFADLLAVTCALNLPHLNEAIAEINRIVLEEFRRVCAASMSIIHLHPNSELLNNTNIRIIGTGTVLSFIVRDKIARNLNVKNNPTERNSIGGEKYSINEWEQPYGPVYQFVLASREVMRATTNGIIANIANNPENGINTIWEFIGKNMKPGDSRSLLHVGSIQ